MKVIHKFRLIQIGNVAAQFTPHQFAILARLISRPMTPFPKRVLYQMVHPRYADSEDGYGLVQAYVSQIRRKWREFFGTDAPIKTLFCGGYYYEPEKRKRVKAGKI